MTDVRNVSLTIKNAKILQNVTLQCGQGEICGIVGRNGSGKTILMKCICGFVQPTEGEVFVMRLLASIRNKIGEPEIRKSMELVGLDPDSKKRVKKYSLGMRQRLGIAQAIMEDPKYLILDEPFNGLDKEGVEEMRAYLLELKSQGKTILLASHSSEDIRILCDTVHEIEHGKLTS